MEIIKNLRRNIECDSKKVEIAAGFEVFFNNIPTIVLPNHECNGRKNDTNQ